MKIFVCILCGIISYLAGGADFAIILSKKIYGTDIRTLGSKNPGFTNFKRAFGWKWAWLVFVCDVVKSVVPCLATALIFRRLFGLFHLGAAFSALCLMLGHCFPIWYKFKGGKGFLVIVSTVWLIDWRAGLVGLAVFALLILTLKYMSLSAVCASLTLSLSLLFFGCESYLMIPLSLACSLLVALRHIPNLVRLIKHEEPKFKFK